jgi:hypothetical protein
VRFVRLLFSLSLAAPLLAQFAVTVQQNGQAFGVALGGNIALNAPAVGQSAAASVTLTYLGAGMAVFPAAAHLTGSANFTGSTKSTSLTQGQSTTFDLGYTAKDSTQTVAQFLWTYNELSTTGTSTGTQVSSGAVSFNLVGTAPNVVVGQVASTGSFLAVPAGGTFTFTDATLNSSSALTIALSNAGSGPATVNSIAATGSGFQLQGVPLLPLSLAAGNQLNVTAVFTPLSPGLKTGSVQIALASGTYTATLSATGISSFLTYQITQDGAAAPLIPNQTIAIDDTKVGAKTSVVIQFQNTESIAAILNTVGLTGPDFSITDGPFLPQTLQPQQTSSITLTYAPLQPGPSIGRLVIGADNFLLSAHGLGSKLQFSYQAGASSVSVNPADTVSFPPVAVGKTESLPFTVTNTGTASASLVSIGVVDPRGVFQLANLPGLPLQLDPNASASFSITFSPQSAGQSTTTLLVNSQVFTLSGFASAPPPLPTYHFTGASGLQQPFQQPSIGLSLDSAYPIALTGTLTLTIASSSFASDPAVQFSSGGRQAAFTIPANTLQAVFSNGATQLRLQTGTVAGAIAITPDFLAGGSNGTDITPPGPAALQLTVPSLAPTLLTAALGSRTATSFSVVVTGFSSTRFLDHLTFQFTPANGSTVTASTATVDLSAAAKVWFQTAASQNVGGEFTVEVPFTLGTGSTVAAGTDLTKAIGAVSVTAANEISSSNTLHVVLP